MKRLVTICLCVTLAVCAAKAQRRISCTGHGERMETRGASGRSISECITEWDANRVYRQPVVLITFQDLDFSMDDPVAYYNRVLNEKGYNEGVGKGCAADYFREQSGGLFNLQFDIYGPIKVDTKAQDKTVPDNYGEYTMENALEQLRATCKTDFSIYDWNGDGEVNQILFICAGYSGTEVRYYVFPNSKLTSEMAPGNLPISMLSISCELWKDGSTYGIGTLVHEFSHCLGLPDLYPINHYDSRFSMVDEWDLMDGGNMTNWGWCPPNYSALEKQLLGWKTPTELTESTSVTGMKPVSEGGETFIIRNSAYPNEFYLLENRQQTGWDYGIPGKGLLIIHVDYDEKSWGMNEVNDFMTNDRYSLVSADGKTYTDWNPRQDAGSTDGYTMDGRLRSRYLSGSAYPYTNTESLVVNRALTNTSEPPAMLFHDNAEGIMLMSKPITNIQMDENGYISFDFMMDATGIEDVKDGQCTMYDGQWRMDNDGWYTLDGRPLSGKPTQRGMYVHEGKVVMQ